MLSCNAFSWGRVGAMMVRLWYGTLRSFDRLTDAFYWVTIDLILWGVTAGYIQQQVPSSELNTYSLFVCGVIMWSIVYRGQMDIGIGLLDELWNKNLVNLFASPLTVPEWVTSLVIFGFLKNCVALLFGSLVAWILYDFFLFTTLGWYLVPLFFLLLMNGWWIGFLVQAVILRVTTKAQAFAWTFVWLLAPLSAIYFPLATLPPSLQVVARLMPTSYIFEEMRSIMRGSPPNWNALGLAGALTTLYLVCSVWLMRCAFKRVLNSGLVKVY